VRCAGCRELKHRRAWACWRDVTEHSGGRPLRTGRRRLSMPVTWREQGKARDASMTSMAAGPAFRHSVLVLAD